MPVLHSARKTVKKAAPQCFEQSIDIMTVTFSAATSAEDIKEFVENFRTCKAANERAENMSAKVARSGLQPLGQLPAELHKSVINLEAGQLAPPQPASDAAKGTNVYVVCDRKEDQGIQVSRERILATIFLHSACQ